MLRVTFAASLVIFAALPAFAQNPPAAVRFLQQATWGPTPPSVAQLQQTGFANWIAGQFALPSSALPDPSPDEKNLHLVQQAFFLNAINGNDQLRQRVAWALSELWVISGVQDHKPIWFTPYYRTLLADAFGNYRALMEDITLNPGMGRYLNMVNNDAGPGLTPNENYARELMQLFNLGTIRLNIDGTPMLDPNGHPIAPYDQSTVVSFSRVFTGWTYPPKPNWVGPMVAKNANHDTGQKSLLNGVVLPAKQTAQKDLDDALDNIFEDPNVPPFVSRQLIQHLVMSNPSPAYVQRVALAFENNGSGVRGDLKAVITAILMDVEARQGDDPASAVSPTAGHLTEPILFLTRLYRALNATVTADTRGAALSDALGQRVFYPPSVFSYFSPQYHLTGTPLLAPEFQIYSPATAVARANIAAGLIGGYSDKTTQFDFSAYMPVASFTWQLVGALNLGMLHGAMSPGLEKAVTAAIDASTDNAKRIKTAITLIAASPEFSIQQ